MHPFDLDHVGDFLLRILLAILVGLVLGWEREGSGKAAGLKTTMLVCLASCSAMLLSVAMHVDAQALSEFPGPGDPARLAAGVLAGIGFLGGGVILRHGTSIHGVTTASVIWLAAILGLVIGAGYYILGVVSTGFALAGLAFLPHLERQIKNYQSATLTVSGPAQLTYAQLEAALASINVQVEQASIERDCKEDTVQYELRVRFQDDVGGQTADHITRRMTELPHAWQVVWRQ